MKQPSTGRRGLTGTAQRGGGRSPRGSLSFAALAAVSVSAALSFGLSGCSMAKLTGNTMNDYTVEHMEPYLLTTDDLGMACEIGVSMGNFIISYGSVGVDVDRAAVGALVTAASCAEAAAWEDELRSLRALHSGQAGEARDARIAEKRAHAVAARRFYRAYSFAVAAYGDPGDGCPKLPDAHHEVTWMLGMLAGVQAVQHDRGAEGVVSVPLDVPRKIARVITECLDDTRWWGVPSALQAAIWTGVPGAAPEGADPWGQLAAAEAKGLAAGMRLAQAIRAQSLAAAGRAEEVRAVIVAHVAAVANKPAPKKYQLLDLNAQAQILALSDRLWTEGVGHRTPSGQLGTFWDVAPEAGDDALLDGLGHEGDGPDEPAPASPEAATPPAPDGV